MEEIYMEPKDYQSLVDSFKSSVEGAAELKYELTAGEVQLQCIDKFNECIEEMNTVITTFNQLAAIEGASMQNIKSYWMRVDKEAGAKTFGESVFGEGN